jgi:AAA+ ATPase superfamily predicted ATPase
MEPESSPFTPGQPAPIEYFVGRADEILTLAGLARAAATGKLKLAFTTGERGIGKSSLLSFVRHLVDRENKMATTHVFLGGTKDLEGLVEEIFTKVLRDNVEKPWYAKLTAFFGKRIKQVGLFGISVALQLTEQDKQELVKNFVPSIRELIKQLPEGKGLLIVLDDINGLASSTDFANWLKSVVDEIATSSPPIPLCIIIVGTEDRKQSLFTLQPSLARIFDPVLLKPWNVDETKDFYKASFSKRAVEIDDDALSLMVINTGGFPVLAQEIGDAVWRATDGSKVTRSDALSGVVAAAERIGLKFLEPQVVQALSSEKYKSILEQLPNMANTVSFKRSDLRAKLGKDEAKVLDNFLRRMEDLGAIVKDDTRGPGHYRFANQLYHLYFVLKSLGSSTRLRSQ